MSGQLCPALLQLFLTLFIDVQGETNIALGNAARIVSHQRQSNLVISDVNIGMMASFLGETGDVVYEFHRLLEVMEGAGSNQFASFQFPFGKVCKRRLDLSLV